MKKKLRKLSLKMKLVGKNVINGKEVYVYGGKFKKPKHIKPGEEVQMTYKF